MWRLILWLLLLGAAWAQALSKEQQDGLNQAADLLGKFGDSTLAQRIRTDLGAGRLRVGATPDNDNAACDTWTGIVTINPAAIQHLNQKGQQFRNLADLAVSIKHEYVHKGQAGWQFAGSVAQSSTGMGHPCEQQAWSSALLTYASWAQRLVAEANAASNQTDKEKLYARAASLADLFETAANDYAANRGAFGALTLTWQNARVSLDDLRGDMRKLKTQSLSKVRQGSFWGSFQGLYEINTGPVGLNFVINDRYLTGEFDGEIGVPAPGRTMYNCHIHGLINGSMEKEGLRATLTGEMWPNSQPANRSKVTGTLVGRLSGDGQSVNGTWSISPPGASAPAKEGKWSAHR